MGTMSGDKTKTGKGTSRSNMEPDIPKEGKADETGTGKNGADRP